LNFPPVHQKLDALSELFRLRINKFDIKWHYACVGGLVGWVG
jgi:hypothetical protein